MAKEKELTREEKVTLICSRINKGEHGGEKHNAVTYLGSRESVSLERFPSGSYDIDRALGGGWPRGRFHELYGPESGGKTTVLLHAFAEYQKKYPNEECAFIDTEFVFDEEYARALGVDTKYLIVHQPEHAEQALNILSDLIKEGITLIGVDSVAGLVPKEEVEGDIGDGSLASQARLMSKAMRRLAGEAGSRNVTIFWTNQLRDKVGVTYGDKSTTPAGRALKYYASTRCSICRIASEKETINGEEIAVANRVKLDVKKNKTFPPFRTAEFFISFGHGIDPIVALCEEALKAKVIIKKGSWFSFEDETIGQGKKSVMDLLRSDISLREKVQNKVKTTPKVESKEDDGEDTEKSTKKKRFPVLDESDVIDVDSVVEVQDV